MQVKKSHISDNEVKLTIIADEQGLRKMKDHVLEHFKDEVKLPGFRQGKAPLHLVEQKISQSELQTRFLEEAVQELYNQALNSEDIRPVDNPSVTLTKFVPYSTLEFDAVVPIIGTITLPDYKKITITEPKVTVTKDDVDGVITSLRSRMASRETVDRAAKIDDEVTIDFAGYTSDGTPIEGADGKDYALVLGSKTFIPGFEENLVGMKADETKTFPLTFPKDYGVAHLAGSKVSFTVIVKSVQNIVLPPLDDALAANAGPFKTVDDLKTDIKTQLKAERQKQADREYESELVKEITKKSKLSVPDVLIEDQLSRMKKELHQNLMYRGQTAAEFYKAEGKTEAEYDADVLRPQAEERVKAGLVLSEIAEKEKIDITKEELEIRVQVLKEQYNDDVMRAELDKPENRREIAARLLTEKTLAKLVSFSKK